MEEGRLLLVDSAVLPPVFDGVLRAKEMLADGRAKSATAAAKAAGISRSAFYKYRDFVFAYAPDARNCMRLNAILSDKSGVFSALTAVLSQCGANLVTVHQNLPQDGTAAISLTVATDKMSLSWEELLKRLQRTDGVLEVRTV